MAQDTALQVIELQQLPSSGSRKVSLTLMVFMVVRSF